MRVVTVPWPALLNVTYDRDTGQVIEYEVFALDSPDAGQEYDEDSPDAEDIEWFLENRRPSLPSWSARVRI